MEENGNIKGALWELLTGAEVAKAVNFSLRLALTADAEGAKEGLISAFGADTLGIGVLSRVGLKLDDPKENETADGAMGDTAGVGASEVLEGGVKEKVETPEPSVALGFSGPLGNGAAADNFKAAEPKENTAGAPLAGGKWKVVMGAAGDAAGREAGAVTAEASTFCGA